MSWWNPRRRRAAQTVAQSTATAPCDLSEVATACFMKHQTEGIDGRARLVEDRRHTWNVFLRFCRPATMQEYLVWLEGFAQIHGSNCFTYDKEPVEPSVELTLESFARWDTHKDWFAHNPAALYVLESNPVEIPDKLWMRAIVPVSLELPASMTEGLHMTELYFMDGFRLNTDKAVIFSDVAAMLMAR